MLQDDLLAFMDSGPDPSLKQGRIVQDGASIHGGCIGGASTFADFYAYINKVDGAGHRFSVMYSVLKFTHANTADILCNVSRFLLMLSSTDFSGATSWTTNKSGGQPTIEIFLDLEPDLDGSESAIKANMVALQQVLKTARSRIDTHNQGNPNARATLGASLTIGTMVPLAGMPADTIKVPCPEVGGSEVDCWECLLHYIDRTALLAYRTANCLKSGNCDPAKPVCCPISAADCTGDTPAGSDGMAFFAYKVLKKARSISATKTVSLGIEAGTDSSIGPDCRKTSFGFLMYAAGYNSNPVKRIQYLNDVMTECTNAMAKAGAYAGFDPDAYFMINDFSSYHCFAKGNTWAGSTAPCLSSGTTCGSGCSPKQPPYVLAGDLNGDGLIDPFDLAEMHRTLDTGPHDTNFNGVVEIHDLLNLLSIWNAHYPMAP
ncbi:MAG: hypothetical protein P8I91_03890 [Phycisphaerales bacterium]|nr:hypothetical protein [Phycisphaerales bacterium]